MMHIRCIVVTQDRHSMQLILVNRMSVMQEWWVNGRIISMNYANLSAGTNQSMAICMPKSTRFLLYLLAWSSIPHYNIDEWYTQALS